MNNFHHNLPFHPHPPLKKKFCHQPNSVSLSLTKDRYEAKIRRDIERAVLLNLTKSPCDGPILPPDHVSLSLTFDLLSHVGFTYGGRSIQDSKGYFHKSTESTLFADSPPPSPLKAYSQKC